MKLAWKKSEDWRIRESTFLIEIHHHLVEDDWDKSRGPHRWAVYAYIYCNHPLFNEFRSEDIFQPATDRLPLHGGCTFCEALRVPNGDICGYKVGADYNHLHDESFTFFSPEDEPFDVFSDAEQLHVHLSKMLIKKDAVNV